MYIEVDRESEWLLDFLLERGGWKVDSAGGCTENPILPFWMHSVSPQVANKEHHLLYHADPFCLGKMAGIDSTPLDYLTVLKAC